MTVHTMTIEQEVEYLRAQNAKYKAQAEARATARLTLKVGKSGGVSLYGMGRYPVTLYRSQWERLFLMVPEIKQFIEDNASQLSSKATD